MSELQKTKQELIEVLDQIPTSGSFEGADLALKASDLLEKWRQLKAQKMPGHLTAGADKAPAMDSSSKK
jgi:hypothetical protein